MVEHLGHIDTRPVKRGEETGILENGELRLDAIIMADPANKPAALFGIGNVVPRGHLHTDFAGSLRQEARENAQSRTLARAIRPFQRQYLPRRRGKADVAENPPPGPLTGEVLHFDKAKDSHLSLSVMARGSGPSRQS